MVINGIESFIVALQRKQFQVNETTDGIKIFIKNINDRFYYAIVKYNGKEIKKFKKITGKDLNKYLSIFNIKLHFYNKSKTEVGIN